jgi:hypothetical protein
VLAQQAAVDEFEQGAREVVGPGLVAGHRLDASRLKSPAKTPRRTNNACAAAPSRSMLHSIVARIVRWRSGMSRSEVASRDSIPVELSRASPPA